jgi:glycosyltransferase involved in cell wall biosynthesis
MGSAFSADFGMSAPGSIWYIHPYAGGPGVGRYDRGYHLARYWQASGRRAAVITASFHHLLDSPRAAGVERIGGVTYDFLRVPAYGGNGLGRLANMAALTAQLAWQADRLAREHGQPELVIASSPHPYAFLAARRLARRFGARCVFEVRDLWPLSLVELAGVAPTHPLVRFTAWLERSAYENADAVVSLLPGTLEYMQSSGLDPKRWRYIPNGIELHQQETDGPDSEAAALARRWSAEAGPVIVYAGALGRPNHVETLVRAMALLPPEHSARCIILGRGELQEELSRMIESAGLGPRVRLFGQLPKAAALRVLREADAGYISLRPEPIFRFGVSPNKLFDYMQVGLPVIFAVRAGNDPVREAGCGISIDPADPEAIANAIDAFTRMSAVERRHLGERGRAWVRERHGYERLAQSYLELIAP